MDCETRRVYVTGSRTRDLTHSVTVVARLHPEWHGLVWRPLESDLGGHDPGDESWSRANFIRVAKSTAIVATAGWEFSMAARREMQVAVWCGLELWELKGATKLVELDVDVAKHILNKGLPQEMSLNES